MSNAPAATSDSNPAWMVWTGRVVSALPVLGLLMSAYFKFAAPPEFAKELTKMGWTAEQMFTLGIIELACVIVYVIPQTSVLGQFCLPVISEVRPPPTSAFRIPGLRRSFWEA